MAIPKRLRREPLIEAIWQCVFDNITVSSVGELLLGILYGHLRRRGGECQVQPLPAVQIPPFVAQEDPVLRYAVKHRLEVKGDPIVYQVGDRVVSVNCRRPYVGWEKFRDEILGAAQLIQETLPSVMPSQHALRYLDVLSADDLEQLRLKIAVGDQTVVREPLHLRVDLPYKGFRHVLQVVYPTEVQLPAGMPMRGTLIDLETKAAGAGNWSGLKEELEKLHDASKAMFFEQVLSDELIQRLEPEY